MYVLHSVLGDSNVKHTVTVCTSSKDAPADRACLSISSASLLALATRSFVSLLGEPTGDSVFGVGGAFDAALVDCCSMPT